MLLTEIYKSKK